MFSTAKDAIIITDIDMNIISWNKLYLAIMKKFSVAHFKVIKPDEYLDRFT
ncbi:hypothetical protein KHA80_22340 [Anaerobacillus sp. HL2]|nr:hypothetical protein KHA80_22340 [Anaerobacillus sp. HL2]